MITATQQGLLALLQSAITGEKQPLPEGLDFSQVVALAKKHQVVNTVYYGARNCGLDDSLPEMQDLFRSVCRGIVHNEVQMYELSRIFSAFQEKNIAYLPLKGAVLKALFPKPDMRTMGDADVLIRLEQYETIAAIMTDLGYVEVTESDHERIWKNNKLTVELHKRLIPSYNKDYYAYFGDGWQLAKPKENSSEYGMDVNDNFVYLFTHFSKHYRDGGIGIRHLLDLWVYRRHFALDETYVQTELTKLQLFEFYSNIRKTLAVCFDGAKPDEQTDLILDYLFSSGTGVNGERQLLAMAAKKSNGKKPSVFLKIKMLLQILFPPNRSMSLKYKVLKKAPVLLPFFWIVRGVTALLWRRKNVRKKTQDIASIKQEQVADFHDSLRAVGLDFHFKE